MTNSRGASRSIRSIPPDPLAEKMAEIIALREKIAEAELLLLLGAVKPRSSKIRKVKTASRQAGLNE